MNYSKDRAGKELKSCGFEKNDLGKVIEFLIAYVMNITCSIRHGLKRHHLNYIIGY